MAIAVEAGTGKILLDQATGKISQDCNCCKGSGGGGGGTCDSCWTHYTPPGCGTGMWRGECTPCSLRLTGGGGATSCVFTSQGYERLDSNPTFSVCATNANSTICVWSGSDASASTTSKVYGTTPCTGSYQAVAYTGVSASVRFARDVTTGNITAGVLAGIGDITFVSGTHDFGKALIDKNDFPFSAGGMTVAFECCGDCVTTTPCQATDCTACADTYTFGFSGGAPGGCDPAMTGVAVTRDPFDGITCNWDEGILRTLTCVDGKWTLTIRSQADLCGFDWTIVFTADGDASTGCPPLDPAAWTKTSDDSGGTVELVSVTG